MDYPQAPNTDDQVILDQYIEAITGNTDAQFHMAGVHVTDGDIVSMEESTRWLQIACQDGHSDARMKVVDRSLAARHLDTPKEETVESLRGHFEFLTTFDMVGSPLIQDLLDLMDMNDLDSLRILRHLQAWSRDSALPEMAVRFAKGIQTEDADEDRLMTAFLLYSVAGDYGSAEGTVRAGYMLENGIGIVQSLDDAMEYYQRASKYGSSEATQRLTSLKARMAS